VKSGEVVLSTDTALDRGTQVAAGDVLTLGARCVVVSESA
jgi:hypothetical protein